MGRTWGKQIQKTETCNKTKKMKMEDKKTLKHNNKI